MARSTKRVRQRYGVSADQDAANASRVVWFGEHRIAVKDIVHVDANEVRDTPSSGLLLAAMAFVAIAALSALLVFEYGWRERFLIATGLLFLLGVSGLNEVMQAKAQRFFTVLIATRTSGQIAFASADESEARDFLNLLQGEGVPVRRAG